MDKFFELFNNLGFHINENSHPIIIFCLSNKVRLRRNLLMPEANIKIYKGPLA